MHIPVTITANVQHSSPVTPTRIVAVEIAIVVKQYVIITSVVWSVQVAIKACESSSWLDLYPLHFYFFVILFNINVMSSCLHGPEVVWFSVHSE